jgi:homoserine acetyltransferase
VAVASCDEQKFELGAFELAGGPVMPQAQLCYRSLGSLRPDRSNLVLVPTPYGAWAQDQTWLMGTIFDPARWCLVVVGQFGNGQSSSPSNTKGGLPYGGWPTSHVDNVHAQRRLLEEVFAVESPALIYGWSMGAQQAYHWGVIEPERSQRLCCIWPAKPFTDRVAIVASATPLSTNTWSAVGYPPTAATIPTICWPCSMSGWLVTSPGLPAWPAEMNRRIWPGPWGG